MAKPFALKPFEAYHDLLTLLLESQEFFLATKHPIFQNWVAECDSADLTGQLLRTFETVASRHMQSEQHYLQNLLLRFLKTASTSEQLYQNLTFTLEFKTEETRILISLLNELKKAETYFALQQIQDHFGRYLISQPQRIEAQRNETGKAADAGSIEPAAASMATLIPTIQAPVIRSTSTTRTLSRPKSFPSGTPRKSAGSATDSHFPHRRHSDTSIGGLKGSSAWQSLRGEIAEHLEDARKIREGQATLTRTTFQTQIGSTLTSNIPMTSTIFAHHRASRALPPSGQAISKTNPASCSTTKPNPRQTH